jgi:D-amino peptidase
MTDIEGVSGIVDFDAQCWPQSPHFRQAQELLTGEVNAAVQGSVDAGADTIVVCDAHFRGQNILFSELHPAAELIHGTMRPHWLPSLEEGFDAFAQIGVHAMAGTPNAILCHSMELDIVHIELNGILIGEIGMAAAAAGSLGIPTVMVSGDRAAVAEMQALVPQVEGAIVKEGLSRHLARSKSPAQAQQIIRAAMKQALDRLTEIPPYRLPPPYTLRVTYITPQAAYLKKKTDLPGQAIDPTTIEYKSDDLLELFKIFE